MRVIGFGRFVGVLGIAIAAVAVCSGMSSGVQELEAQTTPEQRTEESLDQIERAVLTAGDTGPSFAEEEAGEDEPIVRSPTSEALKKQLEAPLPENEELEQAFEEEELAVDDEAAVRQTASYDSQDAASVSPKVGHEALIDGILRKMSSPDEETRLKAGIALRETVRLSDTENLVKVLKRGNNPDKQRFLVDVLGDLQDRRSGEALRFELRHGDEASRRAAVSALGRLHFDWPVPALVRTLRESEDDELKKRAASALGEIGSTSAEYALRTSMGSLEDSIGAKNAAFWALERIRGEVDDERIDMEMPKGRRLQLYYKGTRYFLYHPAYRRGASATKVGLRPWLMVCVHDTDLRVEDMFNICWRTAKKRQMAVLAPYFDNMRYPEYGDFNVWGKERADKRLIEIIEHVGKQASLSVREFYLFGYGTGGDFVQRFAMAYPKRIARASFESDNYTRPDEELFFPRGVRRSPFAPDLALNMYDFIKTETLLVLRKNSPVLGNGKEFFESISHYAELNGVRSRMGVRTVDVKFEIFNEVDKYLFAYD